MPSASIDTFFACSLIVSVALLATASLAGTMQTNINNLQDLNKESYLRTIAEHIVTSYGTPVDWGSSNTVPNSFGLSDAGTAQLYTLDIDKISRLNNQNSYSLSYPEASKAARLNNIALGISVSQMLSITAELSGNATVGDVTTYTFMISVNQDSGPTSANLQCYVVARGFLSSVSNTTSNTGIGYISVQIPNSSNGNALLIVLARSSADDRLTAYEAYMFPHLSQETFSNHTFLGLSPLNNTLNLNPNFPGIAIEECYAFSYAYQSNLTLISGSAYAIPAFLDKSPTILVVSGFNGTTYFAEWSAYPSVPLKFGANFENSEENTFVYTVVIKEALYKLTLSFGDVIK